MGHGDVRRHGRREGCGIGLGCDVSGGLIAERVVRRECARIAMDASGVTAVHLWLDPNMDLP